MYTCVLSRFSRVQLCATLWTVAHQAPRSRDSPGKSAGVGGHFLLKGYMCTSTGVCVCDIIYIYKRRGTEVEKYSCWYRRCLSGLCWEEKVNNETGPRQRCEAKRTCIYFLFLLDGGSDGREFVRNARNPGSIPESGTSPGDGNESPASILAWDMPWTEKPGLWGGKESDTSGWLTFLTHLPEPTSRGNANDFEGQGHFTNAQVCPEMVGEAAEGVCLTSVGRLLRTQGRVGGGHRGGVGQIWGQQEETAPVFSVSREMVLDWRAGGRCRTVHLPKGDMNALQNVSGALGNFVNQCDREFKNWSPAITLRVLLPWPSASWVR